MSHQELVTLLECKEFRKFVSMYTDEIKDIALADGIDTVGSRDEIKARVCFNNYVKDLEERIMNG